MAPVLRLGLCVTVLALTGACTTTANTNGRASTEQKVTQVAATPLSDFNLVKQELPQVLLDSRENPYRVPEPLTCETIRTQLEALTAASIACLTIYDMLKAAEKGMVIEAVRLLEKTGGKSGDWSAA